MEEKETKEEWDKGKEMTVQLPVSPLLETYINIQI
jgi:hypothetical protein